MSAHERFRFHTLDDLQAKIADLGVEIPLTDRFDVLATPARFGRLTVPNRMVVHPMEGCDADRHGAPSELTFRKYERFAAGGSGMLWLEACAVVPEGRANPRQIWLTPATLPAFRELVDRIHAAATASMGAEFRPVLVLQLTHSGRYSKPAGVAAPLIAHHSIIDPRSAVTPDTPVLTDEYLDSLYDYYVQAAQLAKEAGFDAVDIKACHRYLVSELLASFTREGSRYGGSFENRTRLLVETVRRVRAAVPELEVSSRLNLYDALEYPYGWGVDRDDMTRADLSEPKRLIAQLMALGYHGLNTTIGNPYYNPHVGRPFDSPIKGMYTPQEHPLESFARFIAITAEVQRTFPELAVVGSGHSWMRQFFPHVTAALIEQGWATLVGLGRGALAYPDFAKDLLTQGSLTPRKTCITCSACTQIMRDGGTSGCVVRDAAVYGPIYREGRRLAQDECRALAEKCRVCATPTCREKCPAGVNIPAFVAAIAAGNERDAYHILRETNPLPEICAHVCPVEVQCESGCVENIFAGKPVPIQQLQKYVSALARKAGWTRMPLPTANGRRAAVIGAGPAGVACAVRLLEQGFAVTIFDARPPGGVAGATIPAERLPQEVLRAEIDAVLDLSDPTRLCWREGTGLTESFTLDHLLAEGFDSVFLGLGLPRSQRLDAPHPATGVVDGLDFLRETKLRTTAVPRRVAVIGGGNTAMDAAVAAKSAGAEDVYLLYRRSFAELPAWPEERNHALDAGVHFLIFSQPTAYLADDAGRLLGVQVQRTRLGEPDASGRRRPETVSGSDYTLEVELVVEAIGQLPADNLAVLLPGVALDKYGYIVTTPGTTRTTRPGVFAGGDLVNGGKTVVEAVANGVRAAQEMAAEVAAPA